MGDRYNKAGHPTTLDIAEKVEALRDALFRQYGPHFRFALMGPTGGLIAANHEHVIVHAVVSGES